MWHTSTQLPGIQALMTNWLFPALICVCLVWGSSENLMYCPKKYLPRAYGSDVHILLASGRCINQNGVVDIFQYCLCYLIWTHCTTQHIIISGNMSFCICLIENLQFFVSWYSFYNVLVWILQETYVSSADQRCRRAPPRTPPFSPGGGGDTVMLMWAITKV